MLYGLFDAFGNDPKFMEVMQEIVDKTIIDVNNELKYGNVEITDKIVGAVLLVVIRKRVDIEFLRTINLNLNGADETAYGNVNDFLNKLELLYNKAENDKEEVMNKEFGGI